MAFLFLFSTIVFQQIQQDEDVKLPPAIVAKVADYEISTPAVMRLLERSLPRSADYLHNPGFNGSYPEALFEAAVEQSVNQRLVYEYLLVNGRKTGSPEVLLKITELENTLSKTGITLEQYLSPQKLTRQELEFEFEWELAWNWYLHQILTDEYLEQHFQRHRRRFDGTTMRVAHILVKPNAQRTLADATEAARSLHEQLQTFANESGKASPPTGNDEFQSDLQSAWNDAVQQHSESAALMGDNRGDLGEVGWIQFSEPMPPAFSEAAFQLSVGEISPPVATSFGVHLIRCLEVREGKRQWRDAFEEVKLHAKADLFQRIADRQRKSTTVERFK